VRLTLAICFACGSTLAQTAPRFDVASFKRIDPDLRHDGSVREATPTTLTLRNASLGNCIYWAFGYEHFQVVGPNWRDYPTDAVYNVIGKTASPVPEPQLALMLRELLKDRLGLQFHSEQREVPVYALVVDKGGPKFQRSASDGDMKGRPGDGYAVIYQRISMAQFVKSMDPPFTSRHVIDETGLSGVFDLTLDITPYVVDPQSGKPILNAIGAIDHEGALIQALPKQLGLRLERKAAPMPVMVIDHVVKDPLED
jgi:uncharacterized protein (TIGR03435 family)